MTEVKDVENIDAHLQNFAESSGKVLDYADQQNINHVMVCGMSAILARDFMEDIAKNKKDTIPHKYDLINPHSVVYTVGYHLGIEFNDEEFQGEESWRNFSEYQKKIDKALAETDPRILAVRLAPVRDLLERQFPELAGDVKSGESFLVLDEITATGGTLRIMGNLIKALYPEANMRTGAVWKDSSPKYAEYELKCDICGGTGPDIFGKEKMGSYWTQHVDAMDSNGRPLVSYYHDKEIVDMVKANRGEIDLASVPLEGDATTEVVDGQTIETIQTRRKEVRTRIESTVRGMLQQV